MRQVHVVYHVENYYWYVRMPWDLVFPFFTNKLRAVHFATEVSNAYALIEPVSVVIHKIDGSIDEERTLYRQW